MSKHFLLYSLFIVGLTLTKQILIDPIMSRRQDLAPGAYCCILTDSGAFCRMQVKRWWWRQTDVIA